MGKVLPKYLTEWTTNKVRKGKLLQIFSVLCCEYEDLFLIIVNFYAWQLSLIMQLNILSKKTLSQLGTFICRL